MGIEREVVGTVFATTLFHTIHYLPNLSIISHSLGFYFFSVYFPSLAQWEEWDDVQVNGIGNGAPLKPPQSIFYLRMLPLLLLLSLVM